MPKTPPPLDFDFTGAASTLAVQNPLSAGGRFSNASQGVGGNVACTILSDMRVAIADNGATKIAMADASGQDSPFDYMDSIAFVPAVGPTGNFTVTAVLYKAAGYTISQHELEIVLGVKTYIDGSSRVCHSLVEMLLNAGGGADILRRGGNSGSGSYPGANNDFQSFGAQINTVVPVDGSVWVCTKVGNVYTSTLDGTPIATYTGAQANLGTGAGIGSFWRPAFSADPTKYGFRSLSVRGS